MKEDNPFTEHKEIVSRLREPIKIKAVPYATTKVRGHQIQLEMNISWEQIDEMRGKEAPVYHLIQNMIELIEGPLKSTYLGTITEEI